MHQVVFVSLLLVSPFVGAECPGQFFASLDGCYFVGEQDTGPTNLDWYQARDLCTSIELEGWLIDLATFDSVEQLESFSLQWTSIGGSYDYDYPYMWIGIRKMEGHFERVDGQVVTNSSYLWQESHPRLENEFVYLDDVSLSLGSNSFGRLYAVSAHFNTRIRRYVCRAIASE